ncbi:hypothetical protein [Ignatzschineria cameli]|uniref:hypothetical protein n=1 Tax=Ignatzschineria cameli TaxID=2182793 RepID=UPI001EFD5B05|nr:hypothetical protein [Ignatzschineria cameli]
MKQGRETLKKAVDEQQLAVNNKQDQSQSGRGPKRSLKSQLIWMIGLWLGGVISLYLFVKLVKVVMSLVGLYASP